jgi:two-component sensor histidine kinase
MDKLWREWLPSQPPPFWQGLLLAAAAVGLATGVRALAEPLVGATGIPFMVYFPAVLAAAVWGGYVAGAVAALGSAAVAWLLFIPQPTGLPSELVWTMASFLVSAGLLVVVGGALGSAVHAMRRGEVQQRILADELVHRAKNGFAVVQAIIAQSARSAQSAEELERILLSRLNAMAQSQELIRGEGAGARVDELLPAVLAPFDIARFDIRHEAPLMLPSNLTMGLALIVHELATNAAKYGALSMSGGKVAIAVERPEAGRGQIVWRERGGPPVAPTERTGFGARLLQVGLTQYGGGSDLRFEPDGLIATLTFQT